MWIYQLLLAEYGKIRLNTTKDTYTMLRGGITLCTRQGHCYKVDCVTLETRQQRPWDDPDGSEGRQEQEPQQWRLRGWNKTRTLIFVWHKQVCLPLIVGAWVLALVKTPRYLFSVWSRTEMLAARVCWERGEGGGDWKPFTVENDRLRRDRAEEEEKSK